MTFQIDHNKAQLHKSNSKFFVITVSPSQDELNTMGKTPQEKATALREYIRNDIMQQYAENFNRNFNKEDIMYYAKIHHDRGNKAGDNMHAHIIISRKDISNTKKLSPQTNHRNTKKRVVKGGFNREKFVLNSEKSFDKRFDYNRSIENSFEYYNTMKNGSIQDIKNQVNKSIQAEKNQTKEKSINKNKSQEKGEIEL